MDISMIIPKIHALEKRLHKFSNRDNSEIILVKTYTKLKNTELNIRETSGIEAKMIRTCIGKKQDK